MANNDRRFKLIIVFISAGFLLLGVVTGLLGIHNIDTAYNMENSAIDDMLFGPSKNRSAIYADGLKQIFVSLTTLVIGYSMVVGLV